MHHSRLVIPHLDTTRHALDLANVLMSISGISHVEVDATTGILTVDFDGAYLSEESLKELVKGAGYPSAGDEGAA